MTELRRTAIEAGLVARVAAGVRYIVSGVAPTDWFGPMQPLPPAAPAAVAGRSFDFPVGANIRIQPRPDESISFADLRGLADRYDLLRVVAKDIQDYQRVLLDRLAKIPGVANYKSTLIVRDVKRSTELPV